jgi:GNAT superfamily N-acetyltransferase
MSPETFEIYEFNHDYVIGIGLALRLTNSRPEFLDAFKDPGIFFTSCLTEEQRGFARRQAKDMDYLVRLWGDPSTYPHYDPPPFPSDATERSKLARVYGYIANVQPGFDITSDPDTLKTYIARLNGDRAGVIALRLRHDPYTDFVQALRTPSLERLGVDARYRRKHVASRLVDHALTEAFKYGAREVRTWVMQDCNDWEDTFDFFTSTGFTPVAKEGRDTPSWSELSADMGIPTERNKAIWLRINHQDQLNSVYRRKLIDENNL